MACRKLLGPAGLGSLFFGVLLFWCFFFNWALLQVLLGINFIFSRLLEGNSKYTKHGKPLGDFRSLSF